MIKSIVTCGPISFLVFSTTAHRTEDCMRSDVFNQQPFPSKCSTSILSITLLFYYFIPPLAYLPDYLFVPHPAHHPAASFLTEAVQLSIRCHSTKSRRQLNEPLQLGPETFLPLLPSTCLCVTDWVSQFCTSSFYAAVDDSGDGESLPRVVA